jgi:hypothetical protein
MQARGNIRCLNVSRNALFLTVFLRMLSLLACIVPCAARSAPNSAHPNPPSPAGVSRVIIAHHPDATVAFKAQPTVVAKLVERGMTALTGKRDIATAWRTFISPHDVVGIKVYSAPGSQVGTRPEVVGAVIESLLAAGVPTNRIVVWDRRLTDLHRSGYVELAARHGVRLSGALEEGWDETVFYESALLGQLVYGDLEFQKEGPAVGRKSFVTRLLTRTVTKIINVAPLLNHNSVGVCGNLYSLAMGSVDNTIRFEGDSGKLSQAVPEIYALPALGDRVALNIVDALVCQYEGERISRLHNSIDLNQLRFSTDPVALDTLSVQEIRTQRLRALSTGRSDTNRVDLLENAALLELGAANPARIRVETLQIPHP